MRLTGKKGEDGERTLEELVRLAAKPIAYIGMSCPFLPIRGVYPLAGPSREITAIQMRRW